MSSSKLSWANYFCINQCPISVRGTLLSYGCWCSSWLSVFLSRRRRRRANYRATEDEMVFKLNLLHPKDYSIRFKSNHSTFLSHPPPAVSCRSSVIEDQYLYWSGLIVCCTLLVFWLILSNKSDSHFHWNKSLPGFLSRAVTGKPARSACCCFGIVSVNFCIDRGAFYFIGRRQDATGRDGSGLCTICAHFIINVRESECHSNKIVGQDNKPEPIHWKFIDNKHVYLSLNGWYVCPDK